MKAYFNGTVLTMDEQETIYENGVLIEDEGRIVAVGDKSLLAEYPMASQVDLQGKLLMPGLVNAHVHLAQAMLRGQADDMALYPWLSERVWPFQSALDEESFLAGARLAMLEMMLSGTTTFVESMVIHYGLEALASEVDRSGLRAMLSKVVMDPLPGQSLPDQLSETFEESLAEAKEVRENRATDSLVDIWLGPRWTGMYNPSLLDKVAKAMVEDNFKATMHYAESAEDVAEIRRDTGYSALEFLDHKGILDLPMLLIHGTQFEEEDHHLWKDCKAGLVHCPVSAMKVGMGYANVPLMRSKGATICLGTDAAACNNTHDMFREMRALSLLHKYQLQDSSIQNAHDCLKMATIEGAKGLYISDVTGSLEAGKDADMITIDLNQPWLVPTRDIAPTLVYAATGRDVCDVYVRGKQLVSDGQSLIYDHQETMDAARRAFNRTAKKAGFGQ